MKSKWGNVTIKDNHYMVYSQGEPLHRLIWKEFYDCEIPKGHVIHHKDGNPLNNCILNLQLLSISEHAKLHNTGENHPMYGKHHKPETIQKIKENHADTTGENNGMYGKKHKIESRTLLSKNYNTTGYYRVQKHKEKSCKQGFIWRYVYTDPNNWEKRKTICSVDINKLKEKVLAKGLEWIEFGEDKNEVSC